MQVDPVYPCLSVLWDSLADVLCRALRIIAVNAWQVLTTSNSVDVRMQNAHSEYIMRWIALRSQKEKISLMLL